MLNSHFEPTGQQCVCVISYSYDGELQLVHYKSTFDNFQAAAASGERDALAVVAILLEADSAWDQDRAAPEYESIQSLKIAAIELSRPWRGPGHAKVKTEIVLGQLMGSLT